MRESSWYEKPWSAAAAFHGDELRRFSASRYQRGADDVSLRQPRGGAALTFRCRKAVAAAPMCEQEIGQMRA
jgi:hypothetical protein